MTSPSPVCPIAAAPEDTDTRVPSDTATNAPASQQAPAAVLELNGPLPPLSTPIPYLQQRLYNNPRQHFKLHYAHIPEHLDWDNAQQLQTVYPCLRARGSRQVPRCLLLDAATDQDRLVVVSWWRSLTRAQQGEELKALRNVYRAPTVSNDPYYPPVQVVMQQKQEQQQRQKRLHRGQQQQAVGAAAAAAAPRNSSKQTRLASSNNNNNGIIIKSAVPLKRMRSDRIVKRLLPRAKAKRPDAICFVSMYHPPATERGDQDAGEDDAATAAEQQRQRQQNENKNGGGPSSRRFLPTRMTISPSSSSSSAAAGGSSKRKGRRTTKPRVHMMTMGDKTLLKQVVESEEVPFRKHLEETCRFHLKTDLPHTPTFYVDRLSSIGDFSSTTVQQDDSVAFDDF